MPDARVARPIGWVMAIAACVLAAAPARAQVDGADLEFLSRLPSSSLGFVPSNMIPVAPLVLTPQGELYGVQHDLAGNGFGTVFKRAANGTLTTVHEFIGQPTLTILRGTDGNFYGTTDDGSWDCGTVFRLTPDGVFTVFHEFACEPGGTQPTLTQGVDGNFYGTTHSGGPAALGTVFRLTPAGVYSTLHTFRGDPDGAFPVSVVQRSDGLLYGTTVGSPFIKGTFYSLDPVTGDFARIAGDEGITYGSLSIGQDGVVYGWEKVQATSSLRVFHYGSSPQNGEFVLYDGAAVPVGPPLPTGKGNVGVVSRVSGVNVYSNPPAGTYALSHYDGASHPTFQLTAGLTLGADGLWYGVGILTTSLGTDSYIVRFNPHVTINVSTSGLPEYIPPYGTPPTPLRAGGATLWSAHVRGALGTFDYQYWVLSDPAGWRVVQPYATEAAYFFWSPSRTGRYLLQVWVRRTGSTNSSDWFQTTTYFDVGPPASPVTVPALIAQPALPSRVGVPVLWLAGATGGVGPLQYEFWLLEPGTGWRLLQAWSAWTTVNWTPTRAGSYTLQVWVRSAGSTSSYDAWRGIGPFTVADGPLTVTGLPPSGPLAFAPSSSYPRMVVGATVSWTATTAGGDGSPLEYQFFRYNTATGLWTVVRPWGPSATWAWTPTGLDVNGALYYLQVWVRRQSSAQSWEAWANSGAFSVVPPMPLSVRLISNQGNPPVVPPLTPIEWWAIAVDAIGPVEYAFLRLDGQSGAWTEVQPYSSDASYAWTPTLNEAGSWQLQVWARPVGSTQPYEAWAGMAVTIWP